MRTRLRLSLTVQELAPAARQGGLAYLDQVPVGVTDVAADLGLVLFRRREELGTPNPDQPLPDPAAVSPAASVA